jgi:sec-independent protein translocase protein TatA|tara:strand:- start:37 stop:291 length:255 start_codon:yes stop_codon:yes gene_type:complete
MLRPGPLEIGLILVIILIVFGVGKLPQVGEAFGKGIRAFKKGTSGESEGEKETKAEKQTKKKTKKKAAKKVTTAKIKDKSETKT